MEISEQLQRAADELGIRLEMIGGVSTWEAQPVPRHQTAILRILRTIRPLTQPEAEGGCACHFNIDIEVRFPDGSLKRPDISIFCREPDETDTAVTLLPEAVIEIVSKGYEAKDMLISIPFYVSQNVRDIIVLDPYTNRVTHVRGAHRTEHDSPVEITLLCGCICTV